MKTKISPSWKILGLEDEIGLLSQIFDGFTPDTKEIRIALISSYKDQQLVDNNRFLCGIRKSSTLSLFEDYKVLQIRKVKDTKNKVKGNQSKIYKAKVNWNNLLSLTASLHDKEAIEPYGGRKQQEILCRLIIRESIRKKQSKFIVNEEILGQYTAYRDDTESFTHENNPGNHIQFLSTFLSLQSNHILELVQSNFRFDNEPKMVNPKTSASFSIIDLLQQNYFPSAHCFFLINLTPLTKKFIEELPNNPAPSVRIFLDGLVANSKQRSTNINYDNQNSILTIKEKSIPLSPDSNQDYLLRVLFGNPKELFRKWSWDEIVEDHFWGDKEVTEDKNMWKKIYNAACEINKKVQEKIGIKDFLITKPVSTVQINSSIKSFS